MRKVLFRIFTALAISAAGVMLYLNSSGFMPFSRDLNIDELASLLSIKNLVTTIYLGPRIYDTLFEVTVVVLTVVGMNYIRSGE